jgi:hypothetical protein
MDTSKIGEFIDEIDDLVSTAQTTSDHTEQTKLIEEALKRACKMMKAINRDIADQAGVALAAAGLGAAEAKLRFLDVVQGREDLAVFQSKRSLESFLESVRPLLTSQKRMSRERIDRISAEVLSVYDNFMNEKIGLDEVKKQYKGLERFFCRPPRDGGGKTPPLLGPDKGPGGGSTAKTLDRARKWLVALTAAGWLALATAGKSPAPESHPEPPVPVQVPHNLALLSLLMFVGFASFLDETHGLPGEEYVPSFGDPEYAGEVAGEEHKRARHAGATEEEYA